MNKKLIPLLLLSFTNTIGFSILIPVLPFLMERYGGGPILYGIFLSLYAIFQFIGSPILGALSDVHGRKPILLISHGGTLVGWLIFIGALQLPNIQIWTIALPLIGIALARVVDGITGGNMSVASAYLSDSVEAKDRAKAFGVLGATFGFGMLLGPTLGAIMTATSLGFSGVGILAAAVSVATLLLIQFWLPESLPPSKRSKNDTSVRMWKRINVLSRIKHYAQNPQVKTLFFVRVLFSIGFVSYVSIFIFHAIRYFHLNEIESARFMLFTGSFLIVNQMFAVKWFVSRFGESKTFSIGQGFMMTIFVIFSFVHSVPVFIFFYYFLNLGISLSMATFKSLLIQSVSKEQRGEIMGLEESLVALVQSIVPTLAGMIYAAIGIASFATFSIMIMLVFMVIYYHSKQLFLRLETVPEE